MNEGRYFAWNILFLSANRQPHNSSQHLHILRLVNYYCTPRSLARSNNSIVISDNNNNIWTKSSTKNNTSSSTRTRIREDITSVRSNRINKMPDDGTTTTNTTNMTVHDPDVIVVGSGLAGLTVAMHVLDRGGKAVIIEKEAKVGGNSAKASSGINAVISNSTFHASDNGTVHDSFETFQQDTIKSAGQSAQPQLIEILVKKSANAIQWLQNRTGVSLDEIGLLGGHSVPRTLRPKSGAIGWEIISHMQQKVSEFPIDRVQILTNTKVIKLLENKDTGGVKGVRYETMTTKSEPKPEDNTDMAATTTSNTVGELYAPHVVLCTGGFAADRSKTSLLAKYQPQWLSMSCTAGEFTTGDGIVMAEEFKAATIDMEKVQIHPTGFVDIKDPNNPSKILAAEVLRGAGGILLNKEGKRFCNELGQRSYVTDCMLASSTNTDYAQTHMWKSGQEVPTFFLLLSEKAAASTGKHMGFYEWKGLLNKVQGIEGLADWMGLSGQNNTLKNTLSDYATAAAKGIDEYGKTQFNNVPAPEDEIYYIGKVVPVLHYCMGGLKINKDGRVLMQQHDDCGEEIVVPGLYACGEVAGGVHGDNRLGGNSLLECAVYGTIIGESIPIAQAYPLPVV